MDISNNQVAAGQRAQQAKVQNFSFEAKLASLSTQELKDLAHNLNELGIKFDPFSQIQSSEEHSLIVDLELELFLDDPFHFTNIILKRLDCIETELKRRNY